MEENQNIKDRISENAEVTKKTLFDGADLAIAVFCLIFSVSFLVYPVIKKEKKTEVLAAAMASARPNPYDFVALEAKAACVFDINADKFLFEKNCEASLPLASLTKIMTAVTALSVVPKSTIVTIDKNDLKLEGDSGLLENEEWRLADLLGITLIESSNDGAFAVAGLVGAIEANTDDGEAGQRTFIDLMNKKAKELGLAQTSFLNSTGLDENPGLAGGYGSGKDVARLFAYAVNEYPDIFNVTRYASVKVESLNAPSHIAVNTNKDLNEIPIIIASKTGYTDLAGGNLAVIFDIGMGKPIVIVVLGSTLNGRFDDVKRLAWATVDALSAQAPNSK